MGRACTPLAGRLRRATPWTYGDGLADVDLSALAAGHAGSEAVVTVTVGAAGAPVRRRRAGHPVTALSRST